MPEVPEIERINALIRNARSTWFGLLGVLVFVSVTLMGVQHIDFYGVDRATQLPLVGTQVPTRLFFVAAPLLTAAFYGYFHLYLIRLWDVLSTAKARHNGTPLGDLITPWLITDAALFLRARLRDDRCVTPRALELVSMALNFTLAFVFGLIVLAWLWWSGMTARNWPTSALSGLCVAGAIYSCLSSAGMLTRRMRTAMTDTPRSTRTHQPMDYLIHGLTVTCVVVIGLSSLFRTTTPNLTQTSLLNSFPLRNLAPIEMIDEDIVERPPGWLNYRLAKAEFTAAHPDASPEQLDDWHEKRASLRRALRAPYWSGANQAKPNFAGAALNQSFLAGVRLADADLRGADLSRVTFEGARLTGAQLQNTTLHAADLSAADLGWSALDGANLSSATAPQAIFSAATMYHTVIFYNDLRGAHFDFAFMIGNENLANDWAYTNLSGVSARGALVQHAVLTNVIFDEATDFRDTLMDGTVDVPDALRAQMGNPCQWLNVDVPIEEMMQIWRWWFDQIGYTNWEDFMVPVFHQIIPAGPDLLAKYNLTDCRPSASFPDH